MSAFIEALLYLMQAPFIVAVLVISFGACIWDCIAQRRYRG